MSIKRFRKVKFYPLTEDTIIEDDKPKEEGEIWIDGYFEYWGQSTSLIWHRVDSNILPVVQNFILGVVRDRNGNVYTCLPDKIRFVE